MLYFLFALTVGRDAGVSLQDTGYMSGTALDRVFLLSTGEYIGGVMGSGNLLVSGDSVVAFPEPIRVYDEFFGLIITAEPYMDPDGISHSVFKIYDVHSDSRVPIRIVDVEAPSSDHFLVYQDVTICGLYACGISVFVNFSDGNTALKVHRFNASSTQEIFSRSISDVVTFAAIYGFRNEYRDTVFVMTSAGNNKTLYGLDVNLPASSNPVIMYTGYYQGAYHTFGKGGLFQNGSHTVFVGMFASSDTVALMGYDFTYSSYIDERIYITNPYYYYSLYGNGICGAYSDGSSLYLMSYDVFTGDFNETSISYTGYVWSESHYGGNDACIFLTEDGLLALEPSTLSPLDAEPIPSMNAGIANQYPYRDVPSFSTNVLVMMAPAIPIDTVIASLYSFSGTFNLESADTALFHSVPFRIMAHEMMHLDGSLLLKVRLLGFSSTVFRMDEDLGLIWKADTLTSSQNAFLPYYIYIMATGFEGLRKLNLNTGQPRPYFYSIPPGTYGYFSYLKEIDDRLFAITGTGSDMYIHILDTMDLSPVNVVHISGIPLSWNVDLNDDGTYLVFLSTDYSSYIGKIYVYDISADNLIGPYDVDFDPSEDEFPIYVYLDGDTLFAAFGTITEQRVYKCHVNLASCVDASVDPSTYGGILRLYIYPDSVYVSTTGGYIYVMDRNLDNAHAVGPLPARVRDMGRIGDYMAVVYTRNGIVDTTFVDFRRISDLNMVDYSDTIPAFRFTGSTTHEYASGQYYYYLALAGQYDPLGKVYRYNVTNSVGRDEGMASIRYMVSGGRLIVSGRGSVDLKLFDVAGRLMKSYRGEVDGRMSIYRFENPGIYILKLNGKTHKLVNIGR